MDETLLKIANYEAVTGIILPTLKRNAVKHTVRFADLPDERKVLMVPLTDRDEAQEP